MHWCINSWDIVEDKCIKIALGISYNVHFDNFNRNIPKNLAFASNFVSTFIIYAQKYVYLEHYFVKIGVMSRKSKITF